MIRLIILAAATAAVAMAGHQFGAQAFKTGVGTPAVAAPKPIDPNFVPPTEIGMNVSPAVWWVDDIILNDPLRAFPEFQLPDQKSAVLAGQLQRNPDGWPINVPKGTRIIALTSTINPLVRDYSCRISPGWSAGVLSKHSTQVGTTLEVTDMGQKAGENHFIQLIAETENASLTELSCTIRGPKRTGLYRSEFLADLKPFRVVRFMNWMLANGTPPTTWQTRATPKTMSFSEKGMPVEYMVDLANTEGFEPWFTIPFDADDEYVHNFANYVRANLRPDLRAYVELSNEVWNGAFKQSKDATRLGKLRYPDVDEIKANDFFYADRVRHVMNIWSEVFSGQPKRIVRILSNQAAWADRADNSLGHKDTWRFVDAVAIAPYFGDIPFEVKGTGQARLDGILARTPAYIDKAIGWAKSNKIIAAKYGLQLYAYEAGPGLMAYEPGMIKDVQGAINDPRFSTLYLSFLDRWRKEIGGVIVLYNYSEGVWGHLKRTGQPWNESTKMTAAYSEIAKLPNQRDRLPPDALAKLAH